MSIARREILESLKQSVPLDSILSTLFDKATELAHRNLRDRSQAECTRDVVFLFQRRYRKNGPWETESVWLDRDEAQAFGRQHAYNYPRGWQVYGVPSEGRLAGMLQDTQDVKK